jgi:putative restriction endonuclease
MQKNWTREETILAFELYCIIPSKDVTVNNTLVIALANKINRTANSVKLKLQNFKSYDPSYTANGRVGRPMAVTLTRKLQKNF